MSTIADLSTEVLIKTENLQSDPSRAYQWLHDALVNISGNTEYRETFDQLEVYGPKFNLTGGDQTTSVQEYDFANIVTPGDYNLETLDVLIWTDYPTNLIRKQLNETDYQSADRFLQAPSIPAYWYRFADTIGFTPPPNQNYQVQSRIMRRHPIASPVQDTTILLPLEWNTILIHAAAMYGFIELHEYEKAQKVYVLLHGDPDNPKLPGLIAGVKKRRRREAWNRTKALRPVVGRYGWGN